MTQFFQVGPEVAGFQGAGTVVTSYQELQSGLTIPEIEHLDYEFDGWLGDDIATMSTCYIISDSLAEAMGQANLSGYRLEAITVSTTDEFDEWQSEMVERPLPSFIRILMDGRIKIKGDREVIFGQVMIFALVSG